jgi:hypothetical protein
LIHRLTYRPTNHRNFHVRGYKEEGTITTPFDMTVLNDLDRFHLVMDTIDRLPQTGDRGIYLKQQLKDKLIEHKQYIAKHGQDLPEIRNWKGATENKGACADRQSRGRRSPATRVCWRGLSISAQFRKRSLGWADGPWRQPLARQRGILIQINAQFFFTIILIGAADAAA